MSKIDVIKENLQFQQLLYENNSNAILRDEYLIPDTHPDVDRILQVEARPVITSKEIIGEKVMVEGRVEYTVLYIPREDNVVVNSVDYDEKFTNTIDLDGAEHKVECQVECEVEHIEAKIMNERKISIEGVIKLNWEVYKNSEFDFVKDIEASEGVEVLKETQTVNRLIASKETELIGKSMLRVGMDKPQVSKVLKCSLNLHKKEVKVGEDKVYLGCYCKINVIYVGDDFKDLVSLEDDVYLSKEEEMVGIFADMSPSVTFDIENSTIDIEEDDLGEARIINTEFLIGTKIKVFSNDAIDVLKDAYSTKFPMSLVKDSYDIGTLLDCKNSESVVKDNLYLKEGDKKPEKIIISTGNAIITDKKVASNKITMEGIVKVNIIYKSADEDYDLEEVSGDIPFTVSQEINGAKEGMKAIARCSLESIEGSIEANTIAIKASISFDSKIFYEVTKDVISDVIEEEGEIEGKKASITIYFVGKNEALWDLAKKFKCQVNDIMKMNSIDNADDIKEGDKLIIPGRAMF